VPGDTVTDATGAGAGALTVIVAGADWPSLETVTATVPAATAVTRPVLETVAIVELAELHAITRPVSTLLFASRVTADNWTVPPIWRVLVVGDTDIDATGIGAGALTLNGDPAALPSLVALIVAVPEPTALTSPFAATVATAVFELSHVTVLPDSCVPVESRSVAVATAV
jgi:hypothetical protein